MVIFGLCPPRSLDLVRGGVNATPLDACSHLLCVALLLLLWVESTEDEERRKDTWSSGSEYCCCDPWVDIKELYGGLYPPPSYR